MKLKKIYYALPIFILAIVMVGFVAVQPSNSLTMDVNPSIEIVTNRLDRVVEINPLNDDAEELLKDFDPKDKNLERTVNDLVDLMILTGHIKGGEDNFVMITVDDDSMDSKLVERVNSAIAAMLENKKIEATVLNQAISKSEKAEKLTGVALAAHRLNEIDDDLTADEIGEMTVRELIHYSKDHNIPIESLFRVASGKTEVTTEGRVMISSEEAEKIALDRADGEIVKIELDDNKYEVKIKYDGKEYELEIHAITGKIMKFEVEDDDDDNYYDDDYKDESNEPADLISMDRAKEIALTRVGGGSIMEFESDDDEYEVKIKYDGKEYELEIHAISGEIMKFEVEDDDDYYDDDYYDDEYKDEPNESANWISIEEAREIALEEVGGGTITELEIDDHKYEIEIRYDGKEYEMEINAMSGDIIKLEVDDDDYYDDYKEESKEPANRISIEEAKAIALERVGGGIITEFESDDYEFEIEIKYDGKEYEIEIDAYTGYIIDFEVEYEDYDDDEDDDDEDEDDDDEDDDDEDEDDDDDDDDERDDD
ncbi:PepSY domain-containing protein [Gudongella sp. DL1XJH-153]|uniref:PepSY domain-containing protein n=1 Tax=Gudongella sp. DL1XJH-153 TaxID=3409804 RepID=UPI003BB69A90